MAGDWIKMRTDLVSDPRVRRVARMCDVSVPRVCGALFWLWADADTFTDDGRALPMSADDLDVDADVPGLSKALITIGWLEVSDDGVLSIPRFDEHNGKTAKRRAKESRRKRNVRSDADARPQACGQMSATMRTDVRTDASTLQTGAPLELELEREARAEPQPTAPPQPTTDSAFAEWWEVYPRKEGKRGSKGKYRDAVKAIAKARGSTTAEARAWLLDVTRRFAKSPKGRAGQLCPMPSTWLNQGRYDDDPTVWLLADECRGSPRTGPGQQYDPHAKDRDPEHGVF